MTTDYLYIDRLGGPLQPTLLDPELYASRMRITKLLNLTKYFKYNRPERLTRIVC